MQIESSSTPQSTIDEVEKVQRQRIARHVQSIKPIIDNIR